LAVVS
jgi:hypothetical protein